MTSEQATVAVPKARTKRRPLVLLRPLPGTSVIHQLWAGTKLITVFVFGVLLTVLPEWTAVMLVAATVLVCLKLAGVTRGALPTIPRWIVVLIVIGGLFAALSDVGVAAYVRVNVLALVLLVLGLLVSLTTNIADVAPAIARLGRPLRWVKIPVDQWATTVALSLRAMPMLIEEFRMLLAARKLRPRAVVTSRRQRLERFIDEVVDLLVAALVVALRRGDEMGDAITARGGFGQIAAARSAPGRRDAVALAIVAVVCAASVAAEIFLWA